MTNQLRPEDEFRDAPTSAQPASRPRDALGTAIASGVVGLALGAAAILGVTMLTSNDKVPTSSAVTADNALLGGPEYGSRQ